MLEFTRVFNVASIIRKKTFGERFFEVTSDILADLIASNPSLDCYIMVHNIGSYPISTSALHYNLIGHNPLFGRMHGSINGILIDYTGSSITLLNAGYMGVADKGKEILQKVLDNFSPVVDSREEVDQEDILKMAEDYIHGR